MMGFNTKLDENPLPQRTDRVSNETTEMEEKIKNSKLNTLAIYVPTVMKGP